MSRRLGQILSYAVVLTMMTGTIAMAAPMEPVNDPWSPRDKFRLVYPGDLATGSGPTYVGAAFIEPSGNSSRLFGFTPDPTRPGESIGGICSSWNSPPCDTATQMVAYAGLPACSMARPSDCIENVYARVEGKSIAGTFVEAFQDDVGPLYDSIPVANGPAAPASGRMSLWDLAETPHSGGSLYLIQATVTSWLSRSSATSEWTRERAELSTRIHGVIRGGDCSNALLTTTRECLVEKRLPDSSLGLRMRMSGDFGQFIFGRVQQPRIDIAPASTGIVLDVEGQPSATPQAAVAVALEDAPDFIDRSGPFYPGLNWDRVKAGDIGSLNQWRRWSPYLGSRSDAVVRVWAFRSANTWFPSDGGCVPKGEVGGWISTNAMVFEASPPNFDRRAGVMDFRLGGPALTPTGARASADYDFLLRKRVADCLWPGQDLGSVATVSVIDGGAGDEVTSTAVAVSSDWVKFTARNVAFPEVVSGAARMGRSLGITPTIRVSVPPSDEPRAFTTCKEMRQAYRDGVAAPKSVNVVIVKGKKFTRPALGRPFVSASLYSMHSRLDLDRDRLVCEREPRVR